MNENETNHNGYIDSVRDNTQRYVRKLLAENEALRMNVAELESENAGLRYTTESLRRDLDEQRTREGTLQERIAEIRQASDQYLRQFVELEQHNTNLANLYVASYQLHGTVDRATVLAAIQEIVVNLIGSEEFAIFERSAHGGLELIAGVGLTEQHSGEAAARGGRVWGTAESGEAVVLPPEADLVACIPLKLDGHVTGVIAIYALLSHKRTLEPLDYELFDLLASHAATALYCTSLQERDHAKATA